MSDSPAAVAPTAGERLRVAREAAGLSVADVATRLKLSPRQVSAIEAEDWKALPERTFTRGFFRGYARLVGIDEKLIDVAFVQPEPIGDVRALHAGIGEVAHDNTPARSPFGKWGIPALLLLCLAAGSAWFLWSDTPMPQPVSKLPPQEAAKDAAKTIEDKTATPGYSGQTGTFSATSITNESPANAPTSGALLANAVLPSDAAKPVEPAPTVATAPTAAPPTTTVAPATPPSATPPLAPGQRRVNITVNGRSWIEIRSRGEIAASESITDGKREFTVAPPIAFIVGNASNVQLFVDGKPYDFSTHVRNEVARFRIE